MANNSTNAQIITTGSGSHNQPTTLLGAISGIQQFYVIESKGQTIPPEFLTIEGTLNYFKIGLKSGFNEGFLLILLFPVFRFYLFPFVFEKADIFTHIIFGAIPYMIVVINTGLCCYISSYYIGNITRKSINSLFSGRGVSLIAKAFIVYVFYTFVDRLGTPEYIWAFASKFFKNNAQNIYYGFFEIKPHLMPVATESALIMCAAATIPYGVVFLLDILRRKRLEKNINSIHSTED